jgi:hypothetical protein
MEIFLTLLLVDLELDVEVDTGDDEVAGDVNGANNVEHVLIFEGDLLGDLHHTKDDHEVGAGQEISKSFQCASVTRQLSRAITSDEAYSSSLPFVPFRHDRTKQITRWHLHLRTDTHCDDDCKRSDAPSQLKMELKTNNKKQEPRCWPVREGWSSRGRSWGWDCAVGDFLGKPRWPFPGGQHLFSGWRLGPNLAAPHRPIRPITPQLLFGSGAFDWRRSRRLVEACLFIRFRPIN